MKPSSKILRIWQWLVPSDMYFSAAKLAVKTRSREAAVFKEDLWQTQLVHNMIHAIKRKCIADTSPVGTDGLGNVSYYL